MLKENVSADGGLTSKEAWQVAREQQAELRPTERVEDPDPGDVNDCKAPAGMVLRYCGVLQEAYYDYPSSTWCRCGHKIGSI
jgi:hypothetical protein